MTISPDRAEMPPQASEPLACTIMTPDPIPPQNSPAPDQPFTAEQWEKQRREEEQTNLAYLRKLKQTNDDHEKQIRLADIERRRREAGH